MVFSYDGGDRLGKGQAHPVADLVGSLIVFEVVESRDGYGHPSEDNRIRHGLLPRRLFGHLARKVGLREKNKNDHGSPHADAMRFDMGVLRARGSMGLKV